jgi:RNA recognition motif-containing protein
VALPFIVDALVSLIVSFRCTNLFADHVIAFLQVKLYVGNLSFDTTPEDLQPLFEKYGEVSDCFVPQDRESGRGRGFAFITMPSEAAEEALNALNGHEVDGREIRYVIMSKHQWCISHHYSSYRIYA